MLHIQTYYNSNSPLLKYASNVLYASVCCALGYETVSISNDPKLIQIPVAYNLHNKQVYYVGKNAHSFYALHIPESKAKVSQSKCVDSASFSHFPRPNSSFKQSKLHSKMLYSILILIFTMTAGIFDHWIYITSSASPE